MEPVYRQEIHAFAIASETLLSRILLDPPMTADERKIVEFYIGYLRNRCEELAASETNSTTTASD